MVLLKRKPCDVFTNNYNKNLIQIHNANQDIQYITDEYAVVEYVLNYMTKNESGQTTIMKQLIDECVAQGEETKTTIKKLAKALDKGRECGIQEAAYRLLGLPMTKFSEVVKFISTNHPHDREGLLRSDLDELEEGQSIFHNSLHDYYQDRPLNSDEDDEDWDNMTLAEFVANYNVYKTKPATSTAIKLQNKRGYIIKRSKECVIRYYLRYENETEYYRALCILFLPFRNELKDIHSKDPHLLYTENENEIERIRAHFEKHRNIVEAVANHENQEEKQDDTDDEDVNDEGFMDIETTTADEIEDFNKYVKAQAQNQIRKYNEGKVRMNDDTYLSNIASLNKQQRKMFDDFVERITDQTENTPFYLYIGGEAGTGKSFLLKLMIEATNRLPHYSGQSLDKPFSITIAPTGVAAYIVNGTTIESALGMQPQKRKSYVGSSHSRNSNLRYKCHLLKIQLNIYFNFRFLYEDLKVIFLDEVSMCGTDKLTTIHYKMQEIMGNEEFMGGVSVVCTGDFGQLKPVGEEIIWGNSFIDGRYKSSPNHWNDNFEIYYLTQKMRSLDDEFSKVSDKVRKGICDDEVTQYMKSHVQECQSENDNTKFAEGKISIIVTINADRENINLGKLNQLLPNEKEYTITATDKCITSQNPPNVPRTTQGQLEHVVKLKKGAPVMLTSNHQEQRYKNNGIVNGSRGYVDSFQVSKTNPDKVEIIWVCFLDEKTGQLLRDDNKALLKHHKPNNPMAVPIRTQKKQFSYLNYKFLREQFPVTLCYAITSHKSQGQTLEEVIIDFSSNRYIKNGSFYTAMSRVRIGSNLYLRDFQQHYIKAELKVEQQLAAMKLTKPYHFKKFLLDKPVFESEEKEIKIGYININYLHHAQSAKFLNEDENLLNLDLLLVADTRLTTSDSKESIKEQLSNWLIWNRTDSLDNAGHMGMLLMQSKRSKFVDKFDLSIYRKQSDKIIDGKPRNFCQVMTVTDVNYHLKVSFVYLTETPTMKQLEKVMKQIESSNVIMGDFNLDPNRETDKTKLKLLEESGKRRVLFEITTTRINQLDHIFLDSYFKEYFSTCYNNHTSDHKVITIRLPIGSNNISEKFKLEYYYQQGKQSTFQSENELGTETNSTTKDQSKTIVPSSKPQLKRKQTTKNVTSKRTRVEYRCIRNPDNESCWLNSCLQLMLAALDHSSVNTLHRSSQLMDLLKQYQAEDFSAVLDPKAIRNLLFEKEIERIRTDHVQPNNRLFHYFGSYTTNFQQLYDLTERSRIGQQDCRDFFICFQQNSFYWPDVYELMEFHVLEYSQCCACGSQSRASLPTSHSNLLFDPPTADCTLMDVLNVNINEPNILEDWTDEDGCGTKGNCLKFTRLDPQTDIEFLTLIVRRLHYDEFGNPVINTKKVTTNAMVSVKTTNDEVLTFKPVAVIHHIGHVIGDDTRGHYMADILDVRTNQWIRTSDDSDPQLLSEPTDQGYIFLLKRQRV